MRFVYEDLLGDNPTGKQSSKEEAITVEQLEKWLALAKEAVVKAVLDGFNAQKKTEEGSSWWGNDAISYADPNGDGPRLGTWGFTRSLFFQFLRQFLVAFLICSAMVVAMYFTDSLPAQQPRYAGGDGGDGGSVHPAHVTDDKAFHQRFQTKDFHVEL